MIDPLDPTPLYVQVADVLAERINNGTYEPGSPIPSESYLWQEFGVSRVTVRRAVSVLRQRGLVVTMPQRGSYVVEPRPSGGGSK